MCKIVFCLFIWSSLASAGPACNDEGKIYKFCASQMDLWQSAMAEAAANHEILVFIFGANFCPRCRKINAQLAAMGAKRKFEGHYRFQEIALMEGMKDVDSGQSVKNFLEKKYHMSSGERLMPLIVVIDPQSGRAGPVLLPPEFHAKSRPEAIRRDVQIWLSEIQKNFGPR